MARPIIMELGVRAKWQLGKTMHAVLVLPALPSGYDKVGVYICSWGPRDNGQTMNAPKYLVRKAFEGINNGRQGKGFIYVFTSGNGGFCS